MSFAVDPVHGRLTPRVWRSSSIPVPLKIRLWQTLVLTKGLDAVEIRVFGPYGSAVS